MEEMMRNGIDKSWQYHHMGIPTTVVQPVEKYSSTFRMYTTPTFVRFSTVIGGKEPAGTARDPRGFAVACGSAQRRLRLPLPLQ